MNINSSHRRLVACTAAGLALLLFTVVSAFVAGPFASATITGFFALVVYGVAGIALISYAPPPEERRSSLRWSTLPGMMHASAEVRPRTRAAARIAESPRHAA